MTVPPESSPPAGAAGTADPSLAALASACAASLPQVTSTFAGDVGSFEHAWQRLLMAVARSDDRFAFDRDGRPAAIDAVRRALPAIERELFDVILVDVACELAAVQEALYRIALTSRAGSAPGRP